MRDPVPANSRPRGRTRVDGVEERPSASLVNGTSSSDDPPEGDQREPCVLAAAVRSARSAAHPVQPRSPTGAVERRHAHACGRRRAASRGRSSGPRPPSPATRRAEQDQRSRAGPSAQAATTRRGSSSSRRRISRGPRAAPRRPARPARQGRGGGGSSPSPRRTAQPGEDQQRDPGRGRSCRRARARRPAAAPAARRSEVRSRRWMPATIDPERALVERGVLARRSRSTALRNSSTAPPLGRLGRGDAVDDDVVVDGVLAGVLEGVDRRPAAGRCPRPARWRGRAPRPGGRNPARRRPGRPPSARPGCRRAGCRRRSRSRSPANAFSARSSSAVRNS